MNPIQLGIIIGIFLLAAPPIVHAAGIDLFTNPLRTLTEEAAQFDFITRTIVFLFSGAVALVGIAAWRRNPSPRVKWIAIAFSLFAFKWLLKVMDLFVSTGNFFPDHAENVVELASLALIAYAIFAPRKD